MIELYAGRVSKWSVPDDVIVVDALPHTATGKLLKTAIRDIVLREYANRSPDETIAS
jgi:fatty-acyl-CoA synthase